MSTAKGHMRLQSTARPPRPPLQKTIPRGARPAYPTFRTHPNPTLLDLNSEHPPRPAWTRPEPLPPIVSSIHRSIHPSMFLNQRETSREREKSRYRERAREKQIKRETQRERKRENERERERERERDEVSRIE